MLLVKNCRLVPELVEGFEGTYGDILLGDDNRIREIAGPGEIDFHGEVIDAEGNTVLPGFFDLHCHLYFTDYDFEKMNNKSVGDTCFDMYDFAREYHKQGYVVLRDAGSPYNLCLALNNAKDKGLANIPDIISSGRILTPTVAGNFAFRTIEEEVDTVDEVKKAARQRLAEGHHVIKYTVTGSYMNLNGDPGATITTLEELKAAVEVAKLNNTYCMGHAHGPHGIKLAIEAGFHTVEHCSFIDDEAIEMFKNTPDCYMVATGGVSLASAIEPDESITDDYAEKIEKYEILEKNCVNNAYKAGLKIGFGSDLDYMAFTKHPGLEFLARTDWYDFDYKDILLQATKYSAEIAGLAETKGTIKVGKEPGLVIVKGNPDEDIHVMKDMPICVIDNGIVEYN